MTQSVPKSAFWIIFFVVFIDLIGFGIVFPFLPIYTRDFHLNPLEIGWVLGIYSLMQFVFAPILGGISDKIGRRPVLLVSMLGTAGSFLMLAYARTFWMFLIARALDGIAGSNLATAQAYIADISPKEQRTRNLGMWIGAAFGLGFAFGPFIGGALHCAGQWVMPENAIGFPFFAAGILALINVAFAWFKLKESLPNQESSHSVGRRTFSLEAISRHVTGVVGPLILSYGVVILAFAQMEATFSFLSKDFYKLDENAIYWVFGYLGIVMALVQGGLVRRLAPKWGDKNLALVGCGLMVAGLALMPVMNSLVWLLFTSGLLAVGESFANPALISAISKGTTETLQGETMGVAQSLASLSRFLGPVLALWAESQWGLSSAYQLGAVLMVLAMLISLSGFKKLTFQPAG